MTHGDRAVGIVRSLVDLSRALGMCSIAEGVETEQEFELLKSLNCDGVAGVAHRPADAGGRRDRVAARPHGPGAGWRRRSTPPRLGALAALTGVIAAEAVPAARPNSSPPRSHHLRFCTRPMISRGTLDCRRAPSSAGESVRRKVGHVRVLPSAARRASGARRGRERAAGGGRRGRPQRPLDPRHPDQRAHRHRDGAHRGLGRRARHQQRRPRRLPDRRRRHGQDPAGAGHPPPRARHRDERRRPRRRPQRPRRRRRARRHPRRDRHERRAGRRRPQRAAQADRPAQARGQRPRRHRVVHQARGHVGLLGHRRRRATTPRSSGTSTR